MKEKKTADKYWTEIKKNLETFFHSQDQRALHQFRVNVKKLKSLLVLLQSDRKNKKLLSQFKPVRKIFRKAGHIRNAHINIQLSHRFKLHNEQFEKEQQLIVENGTREFCSQGKEHLKELKKARKKISKTLHPVGKPTIRKFYKNTLRAISSFLAQPVFDERLHDCRKQMKYLLHNYKPSGKALESALPLNTDYLNKLQENIGKWHDNILAIDLVSSEATGESQAAKIHDQNTKLRKKIVAGTKNFTEKVSPGIK